MPGGSLVVRGGRVVLPWGVLEADVLIEEGSVAAVGRGLSDLPAERLDAAGLLVMPGAVDGHVHMREPGLEREGDFSTGTAAAAAGGVTTVVEMPNTVPPVDSGEAVREKASLLSGRASVDFGLLGVLHGGNVGRIGEMLGAGVLGFKVFLGPTTGGLPAPGDADLYRILEESARSGFPVVFHAENGELVELFTGRIRSAGRRDPSDYPDSRPPLCEEEAVRRVGLLAAATGGRVHVAHLSSEEGLEAVRWARSRGAKMTAETCPHYLLLDLKDYGRLGNLMKVNPPIRGGRHRAALWRGIADGTVDTLGSDHAPHAPEEREGDVWEAAAGFAGVQTLLPLAVDAALRGSLGLIRVVELLAENPARVFGLYPRKGALAPGSDGDLVLVDPRGETAVDPDWLLARNSEGPFLGRRLRGRVRATVLRGTVVYDGEEVLGGEGRWLAGQIGVFEHGPPAGGGPGR